MNNGYTGTGTYVTGIFVTPSNEPCLMVEIQIILPNPDLNHESENFPTRESNFIINC